jgi:hypothetical protein
VACDLPAESLVGVATYGRGRQKLHLLRYPLELQRIHLLQLAHRLYKPNGLLLVHK